MQYFFLPFPNNRLHERMFKSDVHSVAYKHFKDAGSLYEVHPDLMNIAEQDEVAALLRREIEKVAWGSAALDL
ncbi:MAG: hypothetical protein HN348_09630, partial [Proteobacteria bacterium]|nr:hypothetical protein [Pseudomonadota bacterium]